MTIHPDDEAQPTKIATVEKPWTFLTNHTRVLVVIAENPNARLRDVAGTIGITERATQRIVADLEEAGYLSHDKVGRRNAYKIDLEKCLRHEFEQYRLDIGVVVMGTVGRTGLRGLIVGNTAESVLRAVRCSVLAVKPEGFVTPVTVH